MNCLEFEKIVVDLSASETRLLDAARKQAALTHTENCPRCAKRLAQEKSLRQALRAVALGDASLNAPAELETNLLAAFRAQNATVIAPELPANVVPFRAKSRMGWVKWATAAAAAILLLVLGLARAFQPHQLPTSPEKNIIVRNSPTPTPSVANDAPLPPQEILPEPPQMVAVSNRNSEMRAASKPKNLVPRTSPNVDRVTVDVGSFAPVEPEEISARDFTVFDYAQTMPPPDRSQIMRVQFPSERLAPLGIPIPPQMRNRDYINTDLLVGSDGVPRAIRVVNR